MSQYHRSIYGYPEGDKSRRNRNFRIEFTAGGFERDAQDFQLNDSVKVSGLDKCTLASGQRIDKTRACWGGFCACIDKSHAINVVSKVKMIQD